MRVFKSLLSNLLMVLLMSALTQADDNLTDPYQILGKHYDAIGGLEKIKSEKTSYAEATIKISGLEGTVKTWSDASLRSRQEVDLGIIKQTGGYNGEVNWSIDVNGKVHFDRDEETVKRIKIAGLLKEFDHLNPESENFTVTFEGLEKVGDVDCYKIKIANNINSDYNLNFISTSTFLMEKTIAKMPDGETHSLLFDYRDIDGLMVPFGVDAETLPIGQKSAIRFTKYEINVEIDPALFDPPGADVKDYEFVDGHSAENIPFKFLGKHIFIKVNIAGKEAYWILDTGAGMSVIDSSYAVEVGLKGEGNIKGSGAGNVVNVNFLKIPEYSLSGLKMSSQTIAAIAMKDLLKKLGVESVGILGYDFLSRFITMIDYANETISFYDPENFKYTGNGNTIDATFKGRFFTVTITVDGKYTGLWNFDTGAGGHNFHYSFAEANNMHDLKGIDKMGFGAGGGFRERTIAFETMEFAGFTIPNPLIDIPIEKGTGAFSGEELTGNLGNTLLRHFVIYLDYENQQLIVEKGDDFDKVFPRDKSGLQVMLSVDDEYEVVFVSPGTPADKAGFKTGDIVLAVNNIDVEHLGGVLSVREMLKGDVGTQFKIKVRRTDEQKEFKLKLKDLY